MFKRESIFSLIVAFTITPGLRAVDTDGDGLLDLIDVPGFDPSVQDSEFSGKGIQDLDGVNSLTDWETVNLFGNNIASIDDGDFHELSNLQTLYLGRNQITSIERGDFNGLSNLVDLWVDWNQIASIEAGGFKELESLGWLNLDGNHISTIEPGTFDGLSDLQFLSLALNDITHIEVDGLPNLKWLHMQTNRITEIKAGDFTTAANLNYLGLSSNSIGNIEDGAFFHMENLHSLHLNENTLSELNFTRASFESFSECFGGGGPMGWGLCVDRDEIFGLTLDAARLDSDSFAIIVGQTPSLARASLVGLAFSDEHPGDINNLLAIESLTEIAVDRGLFDLYADEFESFAAEQGHTLTIIPVGDTNKDLKVDFADFLAISNNYGGSGRWSEGDFNRDEQVNFADFVLLSNNYGIGTEVANVPEPASAAMALALFCLLNRHVSQQRNTAVVPSNDYEAAV